MNTQPDPRPLLDPGPFSHRLQQEVARVRRNGGFLSLCLIGRGSLRRAATPEQAILWLARQAPRIVRAQDVLGWHRSCLGLLMPETSMNQAVAATERLLRLGSGEPTLRSLACGVAATYGETEGGGEALLAAAEEALAEAREGQTVQSKALDGRPLILVVDDDPTFAQALAETISEQDWQAHPSTQVPDALQRVATGMYAAAFVDVMLPGVSGVDVVRLAIEARPQRPMILMSGYDAQADKIQYALSLGPVMFIKKPISRLDLDAALGMIRQLLPGARRS